MSDFSSLTIRQIHQGLKEKQFSVFELTQSVFDRIAQFNPSLHAFITLNQEQALTQARHVDAMIAAGEFTDVLSGVPMSTKDLFCTKYVETTAGSRILEGFIPPFDATVIERLRKKDMVLIGKNTEDEFGHGATSEHTGFDVPRNPWNSRMIAGGSSGGSAASVSAGFAYYALGTDTGGSIRQPASMCGIVGLKPTYGRVSRYGVIAMASSLDTIGCFGKTVEDVSYVLAAIAGKDTRDSTMPDVPVPDYLALFEKATSLRGVKIGIPREYFVEGLDVSVKECIEKAVFDLKKLGAEVCEVSLPHTKYGVAAYYIICPSEVSSNMARYDGIRYGPQDSSTSDLVSFYMKNREKFHDEVKRRIMIGTYALSSGYYDAYYLKAQKVRTLVKRDFDNVFSQVDVLVCPTSPTVAIPVGEHQDDPLALYLMDVFTIPASLAGVCGLSLPCGFVDNLPVGLQIIGPQFGEEKILQVGHAYQQVTNWHTRRPELAS